MSTGRRLESIQILRLVAASLVVAFHISNSLAKTTGSHFIFYAGNAGVDIFFVISGFIIAHSVRGGKDAKTFVFQRVFRVVPLYWLLTFAVFAIAVFLPNLLRSTTDNPVALLKSLLFIPYARDDGSVFPELFQGWTLNYEMFFYATFAAMMCISKRPALLTGAVFLALVALGKAVGFHSLWGLFYTNGVIVEFAFGLFVYWLFDSRKFRSPWLALLLPAGLLLLAAQAVFLTQQPREIEYGLPAIAIVLGATALEVPGNMFTRALIVLGDSSYSTYLIHPFVVKAAMTFLMPKLGYSYFALVIGIAVMAAVLAALSVLLFKMFERPVNLWLSSRFLRKKRGEAIEFADSPQRAA